MHIDSFEQRLKLKSIKKPGLQVNPVFINEIQVTLSQPKNLTYHPKNLQHDE